MAGKFMGYGEHNAGRGALESFMGRRITGRANAWCAAFVNASLEAIGQKGTGSAVANSFLNWGKALDPSQVQKGDVAVEHRGRGANNPGGHVGMATGNTRMGKHGLEIEVIQGNSSDQVKTEWERASGLAIRRSLQGQITGTARATASAMGAIDIGDGMTSTGWKKSDGMGQTVPLGGSTPIRHEKLITPCAAGGRSASGGSGGGAAPIININGVNGDPESLANTVQRRLQKGMNRRSHDVDHIYT